MLGAKPAPRPPGMRGWHHTKATAHVQFLADLQHPQNGITIHGLTCWATSPALPLLVGTNWRLDAKPQPRDGGKTPWWWQQRQGSCLFIVCSAHALHVIGTSCSLTSKQKISKYFSEQKIIRVQAEEVYKAGNYGIRFVSYQTSGTSSCYIPFCVVQSIIISIDDETVFAILPVSKQLPRSTSTTCFVFHLYDISGRRCK